MNIMSMEIPDVKLIQPTVHKDHRGFLSIPISIESLLENNITFSIKQVNQGYSVKPYTIRGLHFQLEPYAQAKLISANKGSFFSVAVDLRTESETFGKWCGAIISFENQLVMYVPRGFAHGYLTLEKDTVLQYCVDNVYNSECAKSLYFDDKEIDIKWPAPIDYSTLSKKDLNALMLKDIKNIFK